MQNKVEAMNRVVTTLESLLDTEETEPLAQEDCYDITSVLEMARELLAYWEAE